nr:sporulation integral membrane protein YlbJ [Gorillibacterium massiliense]
MKRLPWTAGFAVFAAVILLIYPAQGLEAAAKGVAIWWDVLFPALFPFFLLSEMLLGFGVVHFIGTLLDPLMRPLFRIPGIGGFVMAMSFASGYPIGAKLTAQLWEEGLISRDEGERLVAFTTSSDPIFLIGAVSVGFFGDVRVALILAAAHYGSALLLGLIMRFHGKPENDTPPLTAAKFKGTALRRSFAAMHKARLRDGRPLGQMLRQAIGSSLQLVFVVGALVVFFATLMKSMELSGVLTLLDRPIQWLLTAAGVPHSLSTSFVNGIFEVTLGAKEAGLASVPLLNKLTAAVFVLSWGGLSVHAQIVSLLHKTNMRYAPFLVARLLHCVMAIVLLFILWPILAPASKVANAFHDSAFIETFLYRGAQNLPISPAALEWSRGFPLSLLMAGGILAVLLLCGILQWFSKKLYNDL